MLKEYVVRQCFADERDPLVKVLKPMREFTDKELVYWNRLRQVQTVELEDLASRKPAKASLGKMTEAFISGLQRDFPATTYTISKIGYKLQSDRHEHSKCAFCQVGPTYLGHS